MSDVVEFLKARLDEDEAMARAADVKQGDPEWFATHHLGGHTVRSKLDSRPTARVQDLAGDDERDLTGILDGRAVSEHIARHDPARVLREVEAKRQMVDEWESGLARLDDKGRPLHLFDPVQSMLLKSHMRWLRYLASVYADHPDYREEWRT